MASIFVIAPAASFCRTRTSVACTGFAKVNSSQSLPTFLFSGHHASGLLPAVEIFGAPVACAGEYCVLPYCVPAAALVAHWPVGSAMIVASLSSLEDTTVKLPDPAAIAETDETGAMDGAGATPAPTG